MTGAVLSVLLVAGLVLNGFRLRGRASQLHRLAPTDAPPDEKFAVLTADGVAVDGATAASAAALASEGSLLVLELVPADLPAVAALDLLRAVDPKTWRTDLLAPGRGAGQALLVRRDLLEQAGVDSCGPRGRVELIDTGAELKRFALRSGDIAVAPSLTAGRDEPKARSAHLRALSVPTPLAVASSMVVYALLILTTIVRPWWGVSAFAVYSLQPYLIFAGGPLRPRCLHRHAALRVVQDPITWVQTLIGARSHDVDGDPEALRLARAGYARDIARGTDRFFEAHRSSCPWCGGEALRTILVTGDRFQKKPGRFTLEECRRCRHVFQNPRLTVGGLEFYYRDFYDGYGATTADWMFRTGASSYLQRAEMLRPFTVPQRWLDVGAGHAHFCVVARDVWPDTAFDGLDMGVAIEDAERRGWVDNGYRGQFCDSLTELAGRYDVISMHHYLEHTRTPEAELDGVSQVLAPGGYLLVEVPDPSWRLGRILGGYWVPWLQPQHQHLMPIENLRQALLERGLTPVAEDRGSAHQNNDFIGAAFLTMASLMPDLRSPWATRAPTVARQLQAGVAIAVGAPLIAAGILADTAARPFVRRRARGNAYRVLAQKQPSSP